MFDVATAAGSSADQFAAGSAAVSDDADLCGKLEELGHERKFIRIGYGRIDIDGEPDARGTIRAETRSSGTSG